MVNLTGRTEYNSFFQTKKNQTKSTDIYLIIFKHAMRKKVSFIGTYLIFKNINLPHIFYLDIIHNT